MNVPELITLDGVKHKAVKPKARIWYDIAKLDEEIVESKNPALDYASLIAESFANVTTDDVLDALAIDELKPKAMEVVLWVYKMVNDKMGKVPNVQSRDKE